MNLVPFLIMKAAHDSQMRKRRSSRSNNSSSNKNNDRYGYGSSSSSSTTYRLKNEINSFSNHRMNACIYNLIKANPDFSQAIEAYMANMNTAKDNRIKELNAELETYCEPSAVIPEKYDSAFHDAFDGFEIPASLYGDPDSDYGKFWYVKPNPNGPHASYHTAPETLKLDGVILTKSEFEAGKNPFEGLYQSQIAIHKDYEQKYNEMSAKIADLEKRKFMLKISSKRREELDKLKAEFVDVKKTYDYITKLKANAEKYSHITPEQKEKMAKFFEVQSEFKELHEKVYTCREKSLQLMGYGRPTIVQDLIDKSKVEAYEMLTDEQKAKLDEIPEAISSAIVELDDKTFTTLAKGSAPSSSRHSSGSVFYDIAEITLEQARKKYEAKLEQEKQAENQANQPND